MKAYKVLKGIIYGMKSGQIVHLTDEQAESFGEEYVEEVSTKPAQFEEKTDEQAESFGDKKLDKYNKKLDKYNNKQIKTAKKNK